MVTERKRRGALLLAVLAGLAASCSGGGGSSSPPVESSPPDPIDGTDGFDAGLGLPLPGLSPDELASFEHGKAIFTKRFKPSEGLGPFYNATSCSSCHSTPEPGGAAPLYRNFFIAVYGDEASQSSAIAPFLSQVVPAFGSGDFHGTTTQFTLEGGRPVIPETVFGLPVISAQRNSIPVFGVGLFEFISNETILSNSDPNDTGMPGGVAGDGIRGRPNFQAGEVGRFGVKAQANNIESFTRAPLQNQMGITTDPFLGSDGFVSLARVQATGDPNAPTFDADPAPDPEMSREDLGDLIAFSRFLAPPKSRPFDDAARRGETTFDAIGCTRCHIPELPSSRGPVRAYTDLLVHNMGIQLADFIRFGQLNSARHFRTQPLWGISLFPPYLHDGRAKTLEDAIRWHGVDDPPASGVDRSEAQGVRDAFLALTDEERADVISFLEHL